MSVRHLYLAALLEDGAAGPASNFDLRPAVGEFKFTELQVIGSTVGHLANFVNATGGIASVAVTAGTLPAGLSVAFAPAAPATSGTVYLTGTVGAGQLSGPWTFTVTATSVGGEIAQFVGQITLSVTDQLQLQPATFYRSYTQGIAVSADHITDWIYDDISNTGTLSFPQALGLPPGLQFDLEGAAIMADTSGGIEINGTPTTYGTFTGTSDFVSGTTDTATLTWEIHVAPGSTNLQASISNFSASYGSNAGLGDVQIGTFVFGPVTSTTVISGSPGGSIVFYCDPAVASGNIYISGVTGAAGVYTGTFRITDGVDTVDITFTLTVSDPATVSATPSTFARQYYTGMTVGASGQTYDVLSSYSNAGGIPIFQSGSVPPGTGITVTPTTGTAGQIRLSGFPTTSGVWNTPLNFSSPGGPFTLTPNVITVSPGGSIVNPLGLNGTSKLDQGADGQVLGTVLSLNPNGVIGLTSNLTGNVFGNWFTPDVGSIEGSKFWVRFTLTGTSGYTNGSVPGSTGWEALTSQRLVYVINSTYTNNAPFYAYYTVQVAADAAGTQIVSTGYYGLGVYNVTPAPPPPVGAPVNPLPGNGGTYEWTVLTGGVTVRIALNSDGTMQVDHQPPLVPYFTGNWFTPTTGAIGNSYWARFTYTGAAPNVGIWSPNVWTPLSSGVITGYNRSSIGALIGTFTVQIATDAGGSNIVSSGVYTLIANREPGGFF